MRIKRQDPYSLVVGMTGVKLGDQFVQIGCAHGGRLAAVAAKVGLSGRAVAVLSDETQSSLVEKAAAKAGVLVEVEVVREPKLPFSDSTFDLAIVDDADGSFAARRAEDRVAIVRELARIVRPGGRAMVIGSGERQGLASLFSKSSGAPSYVASGQAGKALEADGFKGVRTLAEREGLVFVEGIKPRKASLKFEV
jgi:ubiquinone/menaquinone biosynthesis C-methylase UbiE